jgi:DNA-binding CsgD family transcriptional regulator
MAIEASAPDRPDSQAGAAELSTREIEVLKLAASGHSNKSAAAILGIGVKSAESYKARAMDKLGFRSRVELVRFALKMGWLAS